MKEEVDESTQKIADYDLRSVPTDVNLADQYTGGYFSNFKNYCKDN